jgi:hypothetical protein
MLVPVRVGGCFGGSVSEGVCGGVLARSRPVHSFVPLSRETHLTLCVWLNCCVNVHRSQSAVEQRLHGELNQRRGAIGGIRQQLALQQKALAALRRKQTGMCSTVYASPNTADLTSEPKNELPLS